MKSQITQLASPLSDSEERALLSWWKALWVLMCLFLAAAFQHTEHILTIMSSKAETWALRVRYDAHREVLTCCSPPITPINVTICDPNARLTEVGMKRHFMDIKSMCETATSPSHWVESCCHNTSGLHVGNSVCFLPPKMEFQVIFFAILICWISFHLPPVKKEREKILMFLWSHNN